MGRISPTLKEVIKRLSWFLGIALAVQGCSGFVYDRKIDGPYRLTAIDTMSAMTVTYALDNKDTVGRIGKTVFAVGWNKRYIVAKRHPPSSNAVTEYFYLDRGADSGYSDPSKSVTGPLSKDDFIRATNELELPAFSIAVDPK